MAFDSSNFVVMFDNLTDVYDCLLYERRTIILMNSEVLELSALCSVINVLCSYTSAITLIKQT